MTHATDQKTLARWLAADFSNQAQALENPPFFCPHSGLYAPLTMVTVEWT